MPPLSKDKESRILFLDITDELLAEVRGRKGTAWIPETAKVLRSGFYKHFDEGYISGVHLTQKSCPEMADDNLGLNGFDTNKSRSQVNFYVAEDKPDCALVQPTKGHTMIQLDGSCTDERVAEEQVEGFTFEPRCLVIVMTGTEFEMFDAMLSAGRNLVDPFEIQVNYTLATGDDPDVQLASANCHNSHVLLSNYLLDTTGQADRDELESVRSDIRMYENLAAFTKDLIKKQALVGPPDAFGKVQLLSPKPSPPPPPPPVGDNAPPAPPQTVSARALINRYEAMVYDLEAREAELVIKLGDCFVKDRADSTICGLTSNQAPDPWMALNGVKCRGYDTRSSREGDYCGYWESEMNPMAADKEMRMELLSVGPFCMIDGEERALDYDNPDPETGMAPPKVDRLGDPLYKQVPAYCSPNASRTQRSGVPDIKYMLRPDRRYCENKFARQRLSAESGDSIEMCRSNLTRRIEQCDISCDACNAQCLSKVVRDVTSIGKCTFTLNIPGVVQALHSSDVGLDIASRWGAVRTEGRPAQPTASWEEKYRTIIQNNIDTPIAPRNSISCRKPHRESYVGAYVPPLDEDGFFVERKGFHVPCVTDLDCYSGCGSHPVSGSHYVCTHHVRMYSVGGFGKDAFREQKARSEALKAKGEPHPNIWLPDPQNEEYYLIDMPGDDKYDISHGTGVCTDTHYDYFHSGCESNIAARAVTALVGCAAKVHPRSNKLCGVLVDIDEDYYHNVGVSKDSLDFPRVLVEESSAGGIEQQRLTCINPMDCVDKCNYLGKNARAGGLPSPPACALCDPPCPHNIGESVAMFFRALQNDLQNAARLAAVCLNPVACVCQVFTMLKPVWIENLPQTMQECSARDMMMLILDKVAVALIGLIENKVNNAIIDPINRVLRPIRDVKIGASLRIPVINADVGFELRPFQFIRLIGRLCIPYKNIKDCRNEAELAELAALLGCSWDDKELWKRCYYERVKSICMTEDTTHVDKYKSIFDSSSEGELEQQFQEIVGDSFDVVDPSMQQLFDNANKEVNTAAQNICADLDRGSISLDQAIMACLFHHVEAFCPEDEYWDIDGPSLWKPDLLIDLKYLDWKLDDIVFDWTASPPPPPPGLKGPFDDLTASDPEGMEIAREKIFELWPEIQYIAQQTSAANVGRDHSTDGLGYGPVYFISKYSMSTAYLATAHFKNQDSLSARIIQARFTGHFRFACQAFLEFMSDPLTSAAGSNNPEASAFSNPDDYTSEYDRNWLVMATALFAQSYFTETGKFYPTGVQTFWQENCEEPAVHRSAVKTDLWRTDKTVYGEEDLWSHAVPVHSYAPLRAFGSLRQLRDVIDGGNGRGFPEDYINSARPNQFTEDRQNRLANSVHSLYRERMCNPTYKYSINDAIGNPPIGSNDMQGGSMGTNFIRDASRDFLPKYDMWVPNGQLGASAIRRPHPEGCGLNIESGGCDPANAPTYYDSSLCDPDVAPGWHRLLYLKAFTVTACSANKGQTCKSELNRATVGDNFDFATQVAAQFKKEQYDKFKDNLGTKLRSELPLGSTNLRNRRKLFVSPDGVYDLDAMIEATRAADHLVEAGAGRYWGLSREEAALRFDLIRQQLKPSYITFVINSGNDEIVPSGYRTGQAALYSARCSDLLKRTFPDDENVHCCLNAPWGQSCNPEKTYQSRPECNQGPLELADTNEETLGEEFLVRLQGMSPPPSPPPSPYPPPPPSPPHPPPHPSPPVAITADQGKSIALISMRRFCDSVYILGAESRCSTLATSMMTSFVLGDGFSPPPLPPRPRPQMATPPPPPPYPRPRLPRSEDARIVFQDPTSATLSTYFIGGIETDPNTARVELGNSMARENVKNTTRAGALFHITNFLHMPQWAACSEALVENGAVLPCRTGDFPHRCVDGARHCGTVQDNTYAPWVEIDLRKGKPTDRDYYFFALYVTLPPEPEYGNLFFASAQGVSEDRGDITNRFYELEVFDENHNPLRKQCKPYHRQSVDFYVDGMAYFQYVCLEALAGDDEYVAMRDVRFVRLTLLGNYRTLWITGLRVEWRSLTQLPPSLPPPPPLPPLPPQPAAPPDLPTSSHACHTYSLLSFGTSYPVAFEEPCGLTKEGCCALAYGHNQTAAWHLSPSGCCTLFDVPEAEWADLASAATQPLPNINPSLIGAVKTSGARTLLPSAYLAGG